MLKSKFLIIFKTLSLVIKKPDKVQKQKKACKMKKDYPINMKHPGAHLQIVSNECTNFQKNPCTHLLEHETKSCPPTGDRQSDRWTDRQTDRVKPIYPQTLFAGGGGYEKTKQREREGVYITCEATSHGLVMFYPVENNLFPSNCVSKIYIKSYTVNEIVTFCLYT